MALIARRSLEFRHDDPWPDIVREAIAWAAQADVALRDAIMLLPFAQHLPLARREWARAGGWMPRIETTHTLARSIGPAEPSLGGQITFDAALDRLSARRLLRAQGWASAWMRRDPRGFDHAVAALVQAAHAFARSAAAVPPAARVAHWARGRELLGVQQGPGATERLLARVAFEWAAAGATPPTDALFGLRPTAWIVVQSGGSDPLIERLLDSADVETPCLSIDADVQLAEPFAAAARHADLSIAVCADFESEAQRTAAQVLAQLSADHAPVALIAQDRLLVRRVRALLSRRQVSVLDETGWKLSTTRAGALVAGALRAARPRASCDDWLDWLKSCEAAWPRGADASSALQMLEFTLRRKGWSAVTSVDITALADSAAALWRDADAAIARLRDSRSLSLAGWLDALRDALQGCGAWVLLNDDEAGRQVLAAAHLNDGAAVMDTDAMSLDEFTHWLDAALEEGSFRPEASDSADAAVVITPLASAMLRPFAAVILPGADEKRLGAAPAPNPLLSDALAAELGLPDIAERRAAETLAFAQLLRSPHVSLLRRLDDGGEPLAASPLLQRLEIAMRRGGHGSIAAAPDPSSVVELPSRPVARPLPSAPALLPARLSASACEALRACPYRFFALRLLALRDADELDDEVEKRDYGIWLHAVLRRFHATRAEPLDAASEALRLHAIAQQVQHEMHLDEAAFLPYAATFARFAPRYVDWLHERDTSGAQWLDGERELTARPRQWAGVEMHGVIDRVDSVMGDDGPVTQLIDYKTGSSQDLRTKVKHPQEDTQLAFYAALMAQQSHAAGPLAAVYLPLDDADGIRAIEHKNVEASAQQLVDGIARDLARLRDGAVMPALGEGRACEFCEARGLCRRDHWT